MLTIGGMAFESEEQLEYGFDGEPSFLFSYLQEILRLFCTAVVRIHTSLEVSRRA